MFACVHEPPPGWSLVHAMEGFVSGFNVADVGIGGRDGEITSPVCVAFYAGPVELWVSSLRLAMMIIKVCKTDRGDKNSE